VIALLFLAAFQEPPRLGDDRVVLRTPCGDLVLAFYPDVAPKTSAQVLALARAGAYDGTRFRPAAPGAYLQALGHATRSAPLPPEAAALVRRLPLESGVVRHRRGELSMSRSPEDAESAESSFSIILGDQPGYDGRYAVFGRVVEGWDVLTKIEGLAESRPQYSLPLLKAEVVAAGKLDGVALAGPTDPPKPPEERLRWILVGWAILIGAGGAMAWLPRDWVASRTRTYVLIAVLIAAFPLFMISVRTAPEAGAPVFSTVVFCSAVVFFRIMARFEGPPPPSRPSATAT
jgi:peptidyl-prolyl cis-trans isomerase B (cyclophilin B)